MSSRISSQKRSTTQAACSGASGHLYPRIARAKAATAGEKRLPENRDQRDLADHFWLGNDASEDAWDRR